MKTHRFLIAGDVIDATRLGAMQQQGVSSDGVRLQADAAQLHGVINVLAWMERGLGSARYAAVIGVQIELTLADDADPDELEGAVRALAAMILEDT